MIVSHNYDTEQSSDLLSFDIFPHAFPTAMDLDMNFTDHLTTDHTFGAGGADLVSGLPDDSSSTTNINDDLPSSSSIRRFSIDTQTEYHPGPQYDSEANSQSLWSMNSFQNRPANLVLTIENPPSDAVSGVINLLMTTNTHFTMKMQ